MIIHSPQKTITNGEVILSADVEFSRPIQDIPKQLWFAFPESYAPYVVTTSDPFASTLLQIAMFFGENLEVRGSISPRLAYNLTEIMSYYQQCQPKLYKPIQFSYDSLLSEPIQPIGKVGMAFSGGVDSFFTLYKHLPQNQPIKQFQLTHAVFIHGFDIRLFEVENYRRIFQQYQQLFSELGLELIPARTNAYLFSEFRIDWTHTHGAALVGIAQALGGLFRRFYISAGINYAHIAPIGTNPITDPLFSTDTLDIHHTGATHSRYDKIAEIGNWAPLYDNVRVCLHENPANESLNCNHCGKCILTSILLELTGNLKRYTALKNHLSLKDYLAWATAPQNSYFAKIISQKAYRMKRWDIFFPMQLVLLSQWFKATFYFPLIHRIPPKYLYKIKRRVFRYRSEIEHEKEKLDFNR